MSHTAVDSLEKYKQLLVELEQLPSERSSRTIMQVAGYPHYENVCSNILSFYFDPEEEHGLGDLLLQSLGKLAGVKDGAISSNCMEINRERSTDEGNRIDLVINTETHTIAIENKIYHWLANDFADYSKSIDKLVKENDNQALKFVLGLHPVASEEIPDFQSITYDQLWEELENNLGPHLHQADPKWLQYLLDFIKTTKQLAQPSSMDFTPEEEFYRSNIDSIDHLLKIKNQFIKKLGSRTASISDLVRRELDDPSINQWIHSKRGVIFDLQQGIVFELWIWERGWVFLLASRKEGKELQPEVLKNIKNEFPRYKNSVNERGKETLKRWDDLDVDQGTIVNEIVPVVQNTVTFLKGK